MAIFLAQPLSKSSLVYLCLKPSTSYSTHFFTQSVSSFRNTSLYHRSLFCCSTKIISSAQATSTAELQNSYCNSAKWHAHNYIRSIYQWRSSTSILVAVFQMHSSSPQLFLALAPERNLWGQVAQALIMFLSANVSKHWTPTSGLASFFLHPPPEPWPLYIAFLCQCNLAVNILTV